MSHAPLSPYPGVKTTPTIRKFQPPAPSDRLCGVSTCSRPFELHEHVDGEWLPLCNAHYLRTLVHGYVQADKPLQRKEKWRSPIGHCDVPGCVKPVQQARWIENVHTYLCSTHLSRWQKRGTFTL